MLDVAPHSSHNVMMYRQPPRVNTARHLSLGVYQVSSDISCNLEPSRWHVTERTSKTSWGIKRCRKLGKQTKCASNEIYHGNESGPRTLTEAKARNARTSSGHNRVVYWDAPSTEATRTLMTPSFLKDRYTKWYRPPGVSQVPTTRPVPFFSRLLCIPR